MTVLQLSNLKKISKGSTLLLLDRTGGASRDVARELTRLGFGKALVISGGFNGALNNNTLPSKFDWSVIAWKPEWCDWQGFPHTTGF